ncbi:cofactor-independent phosphoglycerate mutase [archaeon]|nr:cofactor-independent phosphoglycerate mutase [archaeon]
MKYIVVIGDGMADYPIEELGGKTPLQVANKPNMDEIARKGKCGLLTTIPEGMNAGSDTANLSILGYDPRKYYTGRGPLEAASIGVELGKSDIAFRCNLITEKDGFIADYCADHITTNEARELILALDEKLDVGKFYPGVSYRHLFVLPDGGNVICTPPHDVIGEEIKKHMIKPSNNPVAKTLNGMTIESKEVLARHPVNKKRESVGKNPANMIWLWGQGKRPDMPTLKEKYDISGAVISAVDLIKGIGAYAGMEVVDVPGATGYYDTNYRGKAVHALKALEEVDYVYLHVESIDEASHAGDLEMKIKTIEEFDEKVLGTLLDSGSEFTIAVLPDHLTPIKTKTHAPEPVPFAVCSPGDGGDGIKFDENSCKNGSVGKLEGEEFMRFLLRH